jgi:hypothetical protein
MKRKKRISEERAAERAEEEDLTRRLQEMIARYMRLLDEQRRKAGA